MKSIAIALMFFSSLEPCLHPSPPKAWHLGKIGRSRPLPPLDNMVVLKCCTAHYMGHSSSYMSNVSGKIIQVHAF